MPKLFNLPMDREPRDARDPISDRKGKQLGRPTHRARNQQRQSMINLPPRPANLGISDHRLQLSQQSQPTLSQVRVHTDPENEGLPVKSSGQVRTIDSAAVSQSLNLKNNLLRKFAHTNTKDFNYSNWYSKYGRDRFAKLRQLGSSRKLSQERIVQMSEALDQKINKHQVESRHQESSRKSMEMLFSAKKEMQKRSEALTQGVKSLSPNNMLVSGTITSPSAPMQSVLSGPNSQTLHSCFSAGNKDRLLLSQQKMPNTLTNPQTLSLPHTTRAAKGLT